MKRILIFIETLSIIAYGLFNWKLKIAIYYYFSPWEMGEKEVTIQLITWPNFSLQSCCLFTVLAMTIFKDQNTHKIIEKMYKLKYNRRKQNLLFLRKMKAESFLELPGKLGNSGMEPILSKRKKGNFLQKPYRHNFIKFQVQYYISYYPH